MLVGITCNHRPTKPIIIYGAMADVPVQHECPIHAGNLRNGGLNFALRITLFQKSLFKHLSLLVVIHNLSAITPNPLELSPRDSSQPSWMMAARKRNIGVSIRRFEISISDKATVPDQDVKVKEMDSYITNFKLE